MFIKLSGDRKTDVEELSHTGFNAQVANRVPFGEGVSRRGI
jgi:hypothetical protein